MSYEISEESRTAFIDAFGGEVTARDTAPSMTCSEVDAITTEHVDYPHEHGRLADCLACEAECFCNPGIGWTPSLDVTPCVYCAEQIDAFGPEGE